MQVGSFPASAANSLLAGYCDDFTSFTASLAQTLEQVSMRQIPLDDTILTRLSQVESGMRNLAEAIHEVLPDPLLSNPGQAGTAPKPGSLSTMMSVPSDATDPMASQDAPPAFDHGVRPDLEPPRPAPERAARTPSTARQPVSFAAANKQRQPKPRPQPQQAHAPEGASEPRSGLRGTNESMPLLSVFQFIERTRKNGIMTVRLGEETMRLEFLHGCVQSCNTTHHQYNERLGDILLEAGQCDEKQLQSLLEAAGDKTGMQLGEVLIQSGVATNGQIMAALETQIRRRFKRACGTPEASYEFIDCMPGRTDGRIRIAPMELSHEPRYGDSL